MKTDEALLNDINEKLANRYDQKSLVGADICTNIQNYLLKK